MRDEVQARGQQQQATCQQQGANPSCPRRGGAVVRRGSVPKLARSLPINLPTPVFPLPPSLPAGLQKDGHPQRQVAAVGRADADELACQRRPRQPGHVGRASGGHARRGRRERRQPGLDAVACESSLPCLRSACCDRTARGDTWMCCSEGKKQDACPRVRAVEGRKEPIARSGASVVSFAQQQRAPERHLAFPNPRRQPDRWSVT